MIKAVLHFFKLSLPDKRFLIEAVLFLSLAKLLLLILPFKKCLKLINQKKCILITPDEELLQSIRTALYRSDRLAFWKNRCLVLSFAGRWMLQRRRIPSRLSIGIARDENKKLIAHAWLSVNEFEVVNKSLDYTELFFIE